MFSIGIPLFFALLQVAYAAPAISPPDTGTHHLQKRLESGAVVALGICIPCVAIVLGLGIGIMWFYPAQRRKLREQNARREAALANVTSGRHGQRQGSEHATLPAYKEHEGSDHELEDVAHSNTPAALTAPIVSAATAQPSRSYEAQPPPDARHAALTV
ncbi:uncharacterized protein EKO05_0004426 [Ascochyta rabiei]|uniref:Uncharacterized protein n=1 Tax=Didymella rabiei TaxID=5454 RepID=A0A163DLR0_DIDRA|nr:uncharacterized protein EKO05_0004426 [Ascochyta rabiei]KZM23241.1 hypothetical protein ST47_g5616 [Ascochyta rabiei]UPX13931.1 hypothetical protein EKO05_0004426 [Ascochyta rabiei]